MVGSNLNDFILFSILTFLFLEDTLTEDKGECVICLDDLLVGHKIARLPCLCIYHKR
jgi:hypothetical protein